MFPSVHAQIRRSAAPRLSAVALTLVLAACGGGGVTSSESASSTDASMAASAPAERSETAIPSVEPIASAAAELCLPAEIRTAIEELRAGNFEQDVPFDEIADAVEDLDVSGLDDPSFAELLRDDLVEKLQNPEDLGGIGRAAAGFSSEVLEDVGEC